MSVVTVPTRPNHVAPTPPPRGLSTVFKATVRSEWSKLCTVRSTIWALASASVATLGFGVLLTALEVSRWNHRSVAEVTGFDPLLYSFAGLNVAQLAVGVLGVLVMSSEYATGCIRLTLAATPQRRLLLAAKVVTFSGAVALVSLASCLAVFFICQALLASKHAGVSITDPGVLRAVLGGSCHMVLIGAIAVGLGAALRRTAGAIAVLFAVLLILPGLVTLLPSPWNNSITRYLPSSAGAAMSAVVRFPNLLSPLGGFMLLTAYACGTFAIACHLIVSRDA